MIKVMIIDDEPIIVEGLKKTINWKEINCTVVGVASNGIDGICLIREKSPDIVFSDISMPKMDGLKMIASIKSQFSDIQITILTGFRDFDYAQRAIELGVCRYLLKPSKMKEINEALEFMIENVKKISTKKEEKNQIEEVYVSKASSFIVENAKKYIENNYKNKLTLSEVAEHIYVSQWHLSKLLNKCCEKNFSEILNTVRVNEAKKLLKEPEYRIGDITEMVGFSDMAHFSRVFKKMEGISPNEYRNK